MLVIETQSVQWLFIVTAFSGKTSVTDAGTDLSDSECLISKMEAMKRYFI